MKLIFVMDLLNGMVVHANAKRGARAKYQPIHLYSSIVTTSEPMRVIEEIRPAAVYIADLNRLMGTGSNREILDELRHKYRAMWMALDYGIKSSSSRRITEKLLLWVVQLFFGYNNKVKLIDDNKK